MVASVDPSLNRRYFFLSKCAVGNTYKAERKSAIEEFCEVNQ